MKSIRKNILLNCTRTFMSVFFPFILFQYASRLILAENLGKVNFSNSIVSYFILIAGLGISSYSIRESGKYINFKEKMQTFASEMFTLNILSSLCSFGILCVLLIVSSKINNYWILIVIQSTAILSTTFSLDWINVVYEDYAYITLRTFVFQLLTLVLTIFFVRKMEDYVIFAVIVVAGKVGPDVLNWFYIRRKHLKVRLFFSSNIKTHIKPVLVIFFSALVISIYVNIDTTMIGFIKSDADVGYYSVAVKIYTAFKTAFSAIISVLIPRMSLYLATHEYQKAKKLISTALEFFIVIIIPLILFICLNADKFIDILFGDSYYNSIQALQIISIGILFAVFASLITNCIFLPLALEKYSLIATSVSAIINLTLNFYFIHRWGIYGAAVTTVFSEFLVFVIAYFFLRKKKIHLEKLLRKRTLLLTVSICLVLFLTFRFINGIFLDNKILNLLLQSVLVVLIYACVLKKHILFFVRKKMKC